MDWTRGSDDWESENHRLRIEEAEDAARGEQDEDENPKRVIVAGRFKKVNGKVNYAKVTTEHWQGPSVAWGKRS